ncbi:hypothetical protein LPB19_11400 [Marinobacter salinisoli]|uniref:Uncharacterized protein n=1 Tax=Marinobacter salinisoli TaxID=2769486 RepID=A0ABX7MNG1_9GAMM|nr:hypothetical protein [Marinobacter salinisoli]QSP93801.1 hypothetical protein LPB19_11400 [Marinobacter salinisoli]
MKDFDGGGTGAKWLYWVIDPIESFKDNGEGEKNHALIIPIPGRAPQIIHNPVLWKFGKRAFDCLASKLDLEITRIVIDTVFYYFLGGLIKVWNGHEEMLEPLIEGGHIRVINSDSEESIPGQESIRVDQTDPWTAYGHRIEPLIRILDNIMETVNLEQDFDDWPYDREFLAAYFTLCHIDNIAVKYALDDAYVDDHELARYWFDKIDNYKRIRDAISRRERFAKWEKSETGNKVRHARRNEARSLVTEDWNDKKTTFASTEKAGIHYADWLREKGFEYEPRTVTNWIRQYAKDNGIRLR